MKKFLPKYIGSLIILMLMISCGSGSKQSENIINTAMISKPKSLDTIAVAGDLYSNIVGGPVYETLFEYDYYTMDPTLVPALAEAMPQVSDDKLVYTFKIKKGVRYYDAEGEVFKDSKREVKAKDFINSLLRMSDLTLQAKGFWLIDGSIKGLNEWREASEEQGGDYDNFPEGLQAIDDYTLKITLTKPNAQLLYFFAMEYSAPSPKEYTDFYKEELAFRLLGTGAYYLDTKNTIPDSIYVYKPNPVYRKVVIDSPYAPAELKGKQLPLNDGVTISVIEEDATQWLKFKAGELDINTPDPDTFSAVVQNNAIVDSDLAGKAQLVISPQQDVYFSMFNYKNEKWGPFLKGDKGLKLRQAVANILDIETEINVLRNGRGVPSYGIIPPGIDGFDINRTPNFVEKDIVRAKELLEEAGYPDGKGLPVLNVTAITGRELEKKFWELNSPNFKEAGFKLEVEFVDFPTLLSKLDDNSYEFTGLGWGADYPDGQNFLQMLYSKSSEDYSKYYNEEFDRLYEQALLLEPSKERTEIYKILNKMIVDDQAIFFRLNPIKYFIVHDWLKGYNDSLRFIKSTHRYQYIDVDLKKSILSK